VQQSKLVISDSNLTVIGRDVEAVQSYVDMGSIGGGAIIMSGRDVNNNAYRGGAYFSYGGYPGYPQDRGVVGLHPIEPFRAASLSINPSSKPADIIGEDTASLGLQLDNGQDTVTPGGESRFVAVVKKPTVTYLHGETRLATYTSCYRGSNGACNTQPQPPPMPMTFYIGGMKMIELTENGELKLFFRGFQIMSSALPNGIIQWQTAQRPVLYASQSAVLSTYILNDNSASPPTSWPAPPGTEVSYVDSADGIIKKAIKQYNGSWRRVENPAVSIQ